MNFGYLNSGVDGPIGPDIDMNIDSWANNQYINPENNIMGGVHADPFTNDSRGGRGSIRYPVQPSIGLHGHQPSGFRAGHGNQYSHQYSNEGQAYSAPFNSGRAEQFTEQYEQQYAPQYALQYAPQYPPQHEQQDEQEDDQQDDYNVDSDDDEEDELPRKKGQRKSYAETRCLTRWTPEKDQLLLLALLFELERRKVYIPWDAVILHVNPSGKGDSAPQHLSKVRKARIYFGQPVPEPSPRTGADGNVSVPTDKMVRNYRTITYSKDEIDPDGTAGTHKPMYTPLYNHLRPDLPHYGGADWPPDPEEQDAAARAIKKARSSKKASKAKTGDKEDVAPLSIKKSAGPSKAVKAEEGEGNDGAYGSKSARKIQKTPSSSRKQTKSVGKVSSSKPKGVQKSKAKVSKAVPDRTVDRLGALTGDTTTATPSKKSTAATRSKKSTALSTKKRSTVAKQKVKATETSSSQSPDEDLGVSVHDRVGTNVADPHAHSIMGYAQGDQDPGSQPRMLNDPLQPLPYHGSHVSIDRSQPTASNTLARDWMQTLENQTDTNAIGLSNPSIDARDTPFAASTYGVFGPAPPVIYNMANQDDYDYIMSGDPATTHAPQDSLDNYPSTSTRIESDSKLELDNLVDAMTGGLEWFEGSRF